MKLSCLIALIAIPLAGCESTMRLPIPSTPLPSVSNINGTAKVEVRFTDSTLIIRLRTSGDNLLHYDSPPPANYEATRRKSLDGKLHTMGLMFVPDGKARCRPTTQDVNLPPMVGQGGGDVVAEYRWDCASMPVNIRPTLLDTFRDLRELDVSTSRRNIQVRPGQHIELP